MVSSVDAAKVSFDENLAVPQWTKREIKLLAAFNKNGRFDFQCPLNAHTRSIRHWANVPIHEFAQIYCQSSFLKMRVLLKRCLRKGCKY
jgi:hypothetical protein